MSDPYSKPNYWVYVGIFLLFLNFIFSIASIVISDKFGNDFCIGIYQGVSFSYGVWLTVNGWTGIAIICFLTFFGAITKFNEDDKCISGLCWVYTIFIFILYLLFQFAWYIVGGILFFTEIHSTCEKGKPLYDFALGLFIVQTFFMIFIVLFGKAKS